MYIIDLVKKESNIAIGRLLFLSVLAGASNAMLLATINKATTNGDNHTDDIRLLCMSILCIGIFILTKKYVLIKSIFFVEELVRRMRVRIINKVRHSEVQMIEEMGTSVIYARITRDAVQVSHSAETLSNSFQALVMVVFTVIYVAFMSIPSFLIIITYFVVGVYAYLRLSGVANKLLMKATKKEASFFDSLDSIVNGFKEIKINKKKNNKVFKYFETITEDTRDLYVQANVKFVTSYLFAQSFFYVLLMIIIFIVPMYFTMASTSIIKISSAILFIVGPMETLVASIPIVMSSNVAARNIVELEQELESKISEANLKQLDDPNYTFTPMKFEKGITINNIAFSYPNNEFSLGPISVEIPKGKITFISGGNGAGKSTFLKLLAGLYYPDSGTIKVDEKLVNASNYSEYRELYSVIFTDFYLFERLYGLEHVDHEKINDLLKIMEIDEKTQVIDHRITERNLSTGQRKRLALAISLLENKSIYVFDEVAADQDPTFKKYFYRELLPRMKDEGKTVIAVTHDDFYFDACDKHYKLEYGEIYSLQPELQV